MPYFSSTSLSLSLFENPFSEKTLLVERGHGLGRNGVLFASAVEHLSGRLYYWLRDTRLKVF